MQIFNNMTAVLSQPSVPLLFLLKTTRRRFGALIPCLDFEGRHIPRQHSGTGGRC
jgi:hypothetical protein